MADLRVFISGAILVLSSTFTAESISAQKKHALTSDERDRYVTEIRAYKHRFLIKELDLNKDTQKSFFELYDRMEDELMQMQNETRELERKLSDDEDASNTELEAAASAIYSQKEREGKVEMEYFRKFQDILTPRQLIKLRSSERKFNQSLLKHRKKNRETKD